MAPTTDATGGCLCGQVRFEVAGPLRPVVCCHCEQCRKWSGHFVAATACNPGHLRLLEDEALAWHCSSARARRGFCSNCGSSLFWQPDHQRYVSIMAGTLDTPTGLRTACHIYMDFASDYHSPADGLPQFGGDHPDELVTELE